MVQLGGSVHLEHVGTAQQDDADAADVDAGPDDDVGASGDERIDADDGGDASDGRQRHRRVELIDGDDAVDGSDVDDGEEHRCDDVDDAAAQSAGSAVGGDGAGARLPRTLQEQEDIDAAAP